MEHCKQTSLTCHRIFINRRFLPIALHPDEDDGGRPLMMLSSSCAEPFPLQGPTPGHDPPSTQPATPRRTDGDSDVVSAIQRLGNHAQPLLQPALQPTLPPAARSAKGAVRPQYRRCRDLLLGDDGEQGDTS